MVYRAEIMYINGDAQEFYFKDWSEDNIEWAFLDTLTMHRANGQSRFLENRAIRVYKQHIMRIIFSDECKLSAHMSVRHPEAKAWFDEGYANPARVEPTEHLSEDMFRI